MTDSWSQLSALFRAAPGARAFSMIAAESGIIDREGGYLVTTIHVRYEILDDPGLPDPDSAPDSFAWGVQAVGLPGNLSAFGVGDTLDGALDDLAEGIRALFSAGSVPDELTRESLSPSAMRPDASPALREGHRQGTG
jgi:hypothetical protein